MFMQFLMMSLLLATTPDSDVASSIRTIADKAAAEDRFSGVVMLAKDGEPVLTRAYGSADAEHKTPNRPDTKFNLGSINKIFTQVAIGQLAQAGKLSMNDTLRKHLPDYPSPVADKITIQQLIDHKSGLGDFFGPEFMKSPNSIRKLSDYLPLFASKPLLFEPGADQRYSNAGFIVLGLIIERESGQSYYDYVRDHIFKPAGMTDTESYAIDAKVSNLATGLTKRGPDGPLEHRRSNARMQPGRGSSAGGGYSTAQDLLRFARALSSEKLLSKEWTDWVFHEKGTGRSLAIAGGSPGVNAFLSINSPYTLVILSNYDPPSAEEIFRASREAMGMKPPTMRAAANDGPGEVLIRGPVDQPMTLADHLPTIEIKINGKGPFKFVVDSGFGGIVEVSPALIEQLKLPIIGEAKMNHGDKGSAAMRVAAAESIDIGPLHFGQVNVDESPHSDLFKTDGVIGLRLFNGMLVTLDYPAGRFRVGGGSLPAADGKMILPYTTEHGVPTIDIDVQGQTIHTDIDSGSPGEITLPYSAAKSVPLDAEPEVVGRARTGMGETPIYSAQLNGDVHIGSILVTHPRIGFIGLYPAGNLGIRFLRNYAVTFDPANKRLRFTAPRA